MKKDKIICFDIETTGLNPFEDEILQLSIVDGYGKVLFDELIKPEHHSEWDEAGAINGITPEKVADKQSFSHWMPTLQGIFDDAELIVGYNCDGFDLAFMEQAGLTIDAPTFDVMLEFAPIYGDYDERHGDYRWQKLTTCAVHYNYRGQHWHNSLEDTLATLHCYYGVLHDQHIIVTEHSVTALTEYERIPDPTINADEMYAYGYTWEGMYPLGQEVAEWMYSQEIMVLQLYGDETEKGVESLEELREHAKNGGIFGIEKEQWNIILDARAREAFKAMQAEITEKEPSLEDLLVNGKENTFGIYQLIPSDDNTMIMFEAYDRLLATGKEIDRTNYQLVYTAPLDPKMTLDDIYRKFNTDLPADYRGRSLSVSDIVVFQKDGKIFAHYVDSIGFREVPNFLTLKNENTLTPDPTISAGDMYEYGYKWYGMHPLRPDTAKRLFAEGVQIYCLYNYNQDERVRDLVQLLAHAKRGGIFGIQKAVWDDYRQSQSLHVKAQGNGVGCAKTTEPPKEKKGSIML